MHLEGAPGVYLFNLFVIPKTDGVWNAILSEGLSPDAVANRSRAYPSSYRENSIPGERGFQVPVKLDVRRTVKFRVSAAAPQNAAILVRCGFDGTCPTALRQTVRLNGLAPESVEDESNAAWLPDKTKTAFSVKCRFPVAAFKTGENVFEIGPSEDAKTVLRACEYFVEIPGK